MRGQPAAIVELRGCHPPRDRHGAPALHADPGDVGRREHRARRRAAAPRAARPRHGARARARAVGAATAWPSIPDAIIEEIGVGQQQRVEILKALYRDARILILDEPTAVLTPQEVDELFAVLRTLVAEGTSIILITHKLHEVLEVADRISVLRRGKKVATIDREGASERSLAELMVGREVLLDVERGAAHPGETVLAVRDLWVRDDRGLDAVRGLSMEVRAGEIVGIAGVDGNGQSELIQALAGMRVPARGPHRPARRRRDAREPARVLGRRRRPHPRGSPAPRARARLLDRREHGAARLRRAADLAPSLARPRRHGRACGRVDPALRRARRRPRDARAGALGRQPAEGRARARDPVEPAAC